MDNTSTTTNQESAQTGGLFDYIASQQPTAADDPELVEQLQSDAPVTLTNADAVETVTQDALPPVQQQAVTSPPVVQQDSEAVRLQQRLQDVEAREAKALQVLALMATEARQREDKLFQDSLSLMSEEEAAAATQARDNERIIAERDMYRDQVQQHQQSTLASQEQADKVGVAAALMTRLGLPHDDQFVNAALMSAQTPQEMIGIAKRMYDADQYAKQAAARTTAQTAIQTGVFQAGGESAPAVPPKKVPERKGELIDMMREVSYQAYAQT